MQSVISIILDQSGQSVQIPNCVKIKSGRSLTVTYFINGAPRGLAVIAQGLKNGSDPTILDTYTGSSNATRLVPLGDNYDSFQLTAEWFEGGPNVSVAASVTSTGDGI